MFLQLRICQVTKTNVDVFLCDSCQINILLFSALNIEFSVCWDFNSSSNYIYESLCDTVSLTLWKSKWVSMLVTCHGCFV